MFTKRTDLAIEAHELWQESAGKTTRLAGVKATEKKIQGYPVTQVDILDREGEAALGKPAGSYRTLDLTAFWQRGDKLCLSLFLCQSAKCKPTRIDALRKGLLFRVDRKCKHTSKYCCKGQTSQHTALFHNLLPLSAFCCNAAFVRFGRCSGHFTS